MPQPLYHLGKSPGTNWRKGWVGSRASLDIVVGSRASLDMVVEKRIPVPAGN